MAPKCQAAFEKERFHLANEQRLVHCRMDTGAGRSVRYPRERLMKHVESDMTARRRSGCDDANESQRHEATGQVQRIGISSFERWQLVIGTGVLGTCTSSCEKRQPTYFETLG